MQMWSSESTGHPSGYCDRLSSDVGSLLRAQESNHSTNFLRLSNSKGEKKQKEMWNMVYVCLVRYISDHVSVSCTF